MYQRYINSTYRLSLRYFLSIACHEIIRIITRSIYSTLELHFIGSINNFI